MTHSELLQRIEVLFEPVEYYSDNGHIWNCDHANTRKDHVIVNYDDSELVTICNECDSQLIGEEWISNDQ